MTKTTTAPRSGKATIWIVGLIALVSFTGIAFATKTMRPDLWSYVTFSGSSNRTPANLLLAKATKGPFLVSLSVQGNLDSQSNITLASAVEGTTTIISIVDEGTQVKEGDVLCELDSSPIREKAKQQEITVTQAEASHAQSIEALAIQEKQNESDIAAAELKLELAILDLEKYEEGDYPQQQKDLSGKVALAEEELLRAQENFTFMQEQVKKGYKTQNEREASRIAVKQADLNLEGAKDKLIVLTKYDLKRQMAEKNANAEEFERELERVKLKARAAENQASKDVEARKLTYEVEKERYDLSLKQIEACVLKAPQNGEVVYASMAGGRGSREPVSIEEGASVRERQAIINLPDVTKMKVNARIHESLIGAVKKGLPARIRVDAYPGQFFNATVAAVSPVPMAGSWPNTDLREYATEIFLTDEIEKIRKLRPGLTAQVEILIDNRPDVLQVPLQAVVTISTKQFTFVLNSRGVPERREVKIGQSNESHVEILDGVEPNEEVVLNPRSRFPKEIGDLEALLAKDDDKELSNMKSAPQVGQGAQSGGRKPGGRKPGQGKPGQGNDSKSGDKPKSRGGFDPAAIITRFDKDGDGQISKDEASGRLKERFAQIDANKDGKISKDEFSKSMKRPQ